MEIGKSDQAAKSSENLWSILQSLLLELPNNPNFRSAVKRLVILATLIVRWVATPGYAEFLPKMIDLKILTWILKFVSAY